MVQLERKAYEIRAIVVRVIKLGSDCLKSKLCSTFALETGSCACRSLSLIVTTLPWFVSGECGYKSVRVG